MTVASNLGFPRIGHRRELKFALERFWAGELDEAGLEAVGAALRARHWRLQAGSGISHLPSGDFSFYDHVLDTACMLGVIPPGYGWSGGPVLWPRISPWRAGHAARTPNGPQGSPPISRRWK